MVFLVIALVVIYIILNEMSYEKETAAKERDRSK